MAIPITGRCYLCGRSMSQDQLVMSYGASGSHVVCKDQSDCTAWQLQPQFYGSAVSKVCKYCGLEEGYGIPMHVIGTSGYIEHQCAYCAAKRVNQVTPGLNAAWHRARAMQKPAQGPVYGFNFSGFKPPKGRHYDSFVADDIFEGPFSYPAPKRLGLIPMKVGTMIYIPICTLNEEWFADHAKAEIDELEKAFESVGAAVQVEFDKRFRRIYLRSGIIPDTTKLEKVHEIPWQKAEDTLEFATYAVGILRAGGTIVPVMKNDYVFEIWMPIEGA